MQQNKDKTNFVLTKSKIKQKAQEQNPTPNKYFFQKVSKKVRTNGSSKQAAQPPKVIHANRPTPKHFRQQIKVFF